MPYLLPTNFHQLGHKHRALSMGNSLSMGSRLILNTTRPGSRLLDAAQTKPRGSCLRLSQRDTVRLHGFSTPHENIPRYVQNGELAFCNRFLLANVWPGKHQKEGSWKERGTITRVGISRFRHLFLWEARIPKREPRPFPGTQCNHRGAGRVKGSIIHPRSHGSIVTKPLNTPLQCVKVEEWLKSSEKNQSQAHLHTTQIAPPKNHNTKSSPLSHSSTHKFPHMPHRNPPTLQLPRAFPPLFNFLPHKPEIHPLFNFLYGLPNLAISCFLAHWGHFLSTYTRFLHDLTYLRNFVKSDNLCIQTYV